jgi:predicted CxxxxCH...CXXCH cytochrome family protein
MRSPLALLGTGGLLLAFGVFNTQLVVSDDELNLREFNPAHHCNDCHGTQGPDGDPTLGDEQAIELLCLSCHGPGGVSVLKADVHDSSGGRHSCLTCHNPHINPDNWLGGENLKMVGNFDFNSWPWIGRIASPNSGLREVVFESLGVDQGGPSLHSFADNDEDGNGYYDGVCETCHTETNHHRNFEPDLPDHYTGTNCMTCHPHAEGFVPQGGSCVGCHAGPQGARRPVVGEFPVDDPHAHYGAALDDGACLVCHDLGTHMNGFVELVDADTGALYSFQQPGDLTADPDLSDFCAACHDADGALRLTTPLDPFGNGNLPPDVDTKFQGTLQWNEWYGDMCFGEEGTLRGVNSHHDISDADQLFSGARIECVDCHGAHSVSAAQPMSDPFDTTVPWAGTESDFCLSCHAGGLGPLDPGFPPGVVGPTIPMRGVDSCDYTSQPWYVDYRWQHTAHGPDSKRGWLGYSGAPSYEVRCLDCHDSHGSYTPTNTLGNPYMIRDVVDGTMYVDDGVRPGGAWNGPPWDTFGTIREVTVTITGTDVDWGSPDSLCGTCHGAWQSAYSWHSLCTGCQSCHGHGQVWGEYDWHDSNDGTPCDPGKSSFDKDELPWLHLMAPDRPIPDEGECPMMKK